ncbi:1-phosphofructokinase family hexose kinase [Agromyces allii]|uniref:1-phosphofructokinase family hexose kinase n=1 Tax=Agromyces allii TaxID=393607 RepID=A0ABP5BM30_9MICO|nr:PfkB family carbohydrate kinase [Agromyces allii]
MILTVTPNPALDLTWHVERLVPGETHRVPAGASRAGGKGVNVARVLHAQGVDVLALATAGGATGDEFAADLVASGVPHELVPVRGATRRSIAIVDTDAAHTAVLNEHGSPLSSDEAAALDAAVLDAAQQARDARAEHGEAGEGDERDGRGERPPATSGAHPNNLDGRELDVVVISGSLPPGYAPERLGALVTALNAAGLRAIVDTSGPGLLEAARAGAYALKPNGEELAAATGLTDPEAGARRLLELGATLVVVSLGGDGLLLVSRAEAGRPVRARLPRVLRGNATGAGDAAVAAIAATIAESIAFDADSPRAADARRRLARKAVAWSASAVLVPLAGELSPEHAALEAEVVVDPPRTAPTEHPDRPRNTAGAETTDTTDDTETAEDPA